MTVLCSVRALFLTVRSFFLKNLTSEQSFKRFTRVVLTRRLNWARLWKLGSWNVYKIGHRLRPVLFNECYIQGTCQTAQLPICPLQIWIICVTMKRDSLVFYTFISRSSSLAKTRRHRLAQLDDVKVQPGEYLPWSLSGHRSRTVRASSRRLCRSLRQRQERRNSRHTSCSP